MITIDEAIEFCEYNAKKNAKAFAEVGYITRWNGERVDEIFGNIAAYMKDFKRRLLSEVLLLEVPNKITKLYAIENIATGEIIFNARGGAYKKPEEAIAKLDKLEDGKYRLVTYELKEG